MNMSFLLAGSASTNPVLFTLAIGLILAWRVAGYYGLDRYLLPCARCAVEAGPRLQRAGQSRSGGGLSGSASGTPGMVIEGRSPRAASRPQASRRWTAPRSSTA